MNGHNTSREIRKIEKNRLYSREELVEFLGVDDEKITLFFQCGLEAYRENLRPGSRKDVLGADLKRFLKKWSFALNTIEVMKEKGMLKKWLQ